MTKKPEEFVHIADEAWAAACAAFPRSVAEETPNIIQWAAEALQAYGDEARSQAFEEAAKIAEGWEWEGPDKLLPLASAETNHGADVGMYEAADRIAQEIRKAKVDKRLNVLKKGCGYPCGYDCNGACFDASDGSDASLLAQPMDAAPKDGTMLRLLVRFDGDNSVGAFEDTDTGWTIGTNNLANTGEDQWDIVGWDWEQDTFRQAHTAEPIGWLPLLTTKEGKRTLWAENERLRAALAPFAEIAPFVQNTDRRDGERVHEQRRPDGTWCILTRADFRNAFDVHSAIRQHSQKGEDNADDN